jgi:hypothetical protein
MQRLFLHDFQFQPLFRKTLQRTKYHTSHLRSAAEPGASVRFDQKPTQKAERRDRDCRSKGASDGGRSSLTETISSSSAF